MNCVVTRLPNRAINLGCKLATLLDQDLWRPMHTERGQTLGCAEVISVRQQPTRPESPKTIMHPRLHLAQKFNFIVVIRCSGVGTAGYLLR